MKPSPPLLRQHITAREPSPSTPSSSRFHGLNLDCEVFDSRFDDFFVITIADFDCVGVGARFEDDIVFLRQTFVHVSRQTIETTKGRHCSDDAVVKQRLEVLFLSERGSFTNRFPNLFEVDLMIRRKHGHHVLLARFYYDNLRMVPAFHVLGLGDPLGGHGFGMMQNLVADFIFIQTIDELFWYFHEQLQWETITSTDDLYFRVTVSTRGKPRSSLLSLAKNRADTAAKAATRERLLVWLHAKFVKMSMTRPLR